ncbi:MAG: DUF3095 family protein [Alphaproteobacteria bacterium]|nr:DUF3095 family protein [Alphaproteobacteria bacterium]
MGASSGGTSSGGGFYKNLPPLSASQDMVDISLHHRVPADWFVLVADIKGSTKAIAAGQYKAVNMLSASAITAALNAVRGATGGDTNDSIAYIFGGDGATFLVPPELLLPVARALQGTRRMAQADYGLAMRAGAVRVEELEKQGAPVSVAKTKVSPGLSQAALSGAGIGLAEKLVKDEERGPALDVSAIFSAAELSAAPPDFTGLQCRWEPLKNRRGLNLSLIVLAREEGASGAQVYQTALSRIGGICGMPESWRPAGADNLRLTLDPRQMGMELKTNTFTGANGRLAYFLRMWGGTLFGKLSIATGKKLGGFDGRAYVDATARHTDYIKFDNALRLIMDITQAQKAALEGMLEEMRGQGLLFYGMHTADAALMTCMSFDHGEEHFHFVDGADGGYALAAVQLKQQIAAAAQGIAA